MVWTCFKNEQRENPKEGFEHESERKMPMWETKIKMRTAGLERCHTEGRENIRTNCRRKSCGKLGTRDGWKGLVVR
jgi:hypothetical protein